MANTTIGSSTNKTGFYKIKVGHPGIYNLVFSFIGYRKKVVAIEILPSSSRTINAALQPKTIQLEKLSVTGSNKTWEEQFERFKKEFIGTTAFAEKTTILNPEVLRCDVDEEKNLLLAKATQPLIIVNKALGYKIYTELVNFKWSLYEPKGFYVVYPKYEPLTTNSQKLFEEQATGNIIVLQIRYLTTIV